MGPPAGRDIMEHSSGKKERLILAAGLALSLGAAAWQFFSPASRALLAGRDISLALLGERSSALLVYHPFSSTVNAFTMAHRKAKAGASGLKRAGDLAQAAGTSAGEEIFYIALSSAPDLDAFWGALNTWRSEPRLFFSAAAWVYGLRTSGRTNLSAFDLFSLFTEFSGLNSSNFILTEVSRRTQAADEAEEEAPAPAPLIEVFNASGREGLAALAAKRLRSLGFDVITEGNYSKIEKHTRINGYSKDMAAALKLREALGLGETVPERSSRKSVAGAAVILGQDFDEKKLGR